MVFQNYALYPHMTVFANMAYGLKIAKVPEAEIRARVDKAAKILELGPFLQRKPRELSGGQRQRVAMGRAIVRQPAVFLFDEPLSNLDAKLRAQTRLEIQKLHGELRTTSLFVTHDQVEAMTLAERMIVMNAGRMEQIGTPDEVYHRPATTFVAGFIGSPPMNLVRGTSEGAGFKAGGQLLPLPQPAPRAGELVMGVRPEHVELSFDLQASGWPLARAGARDAGRGAPRLRHARRDPLHRPDRRDRAASEDRRHRQHRGHARAHALVRRGDDGTRRRLSRRRSRPWRPGRTRAGSRTAAPASWRRRTRSPPFASARATATAPSNAT